MRVEDIFFYSFNSLRQRSLRSWLTVLGIVVGITAIVVLVGLVQGLRDYFTDQLSTFGARTIVVLPVNIESGGNPAGSSWLPSNGKLFLKDLDRIKRIPGVSAITPVITGRATITYKDKDITSSVIGIDPAEYLATASSVQVENGRFLESVDQKSVVIGSTVATDSFKDDVLLSSGLYINGEKYRVVGILNKSGSSFASTDSAILIPFHEAELLFKDILSEHEISSIRLTVDEGTSIQETADRITSELIATHRVTEDKKDFGVITADFINQQLDTVTGILGLFLGGVAGISLVVGGVGIANTMFMSVTERRREIGILKSIGAKQSEILTLFLVESSMIGLGGGLIGLLFAYGIAFVITALSGVHVSISPLVVAGAILFSAGVGVISGIIPANQAAKLDPVEALNT